MPENTSVEQKVFNLVVELAAAKKAKKDSVKAYNEEIKRISKEIDELIDETDEGFEQ